MPVVRMQRPQVVNFFRYYHHTEEVPYLIAALYR